MNVLNKLLVYKIYYNIFLQELLTKIITFVFQIDRTGYFLSNLCNIILNSNHNPVRFQKNNRLVKRPIKMPSVSNQERSAYSGMREKPAHE